MFHFALAQIKEVPFNQQIITILLSYPTLFPIHLCNPNKIKLDNEEKKR
jgi:hypothetical protein